jgi:hypothetical protein
MTATSDGPLPTAGALCAADALGAKPSVEATTVAPAPVRKSRRAPESIVDLLIKPSCRVQNRCFLCTPIITGLPEARTKPRLKQPCRFEVKERAEKDCPGGAARWVDVSAPIEDFRRVYDEQTSDLRCSFCGKRPFHSGVATLREPLLPSADNASRAITEPSRTMMRRREK